MALKFSKTSVNLTKVGFLVADPSELYRELLVRLLHGFGAKAVHQAISVETANRVLHTKPVDFLICAADLPRVAGSSKPEGIEFVRAIRLNTEHEQRAIPIVITMGTARRITVGQARDCGANFVLSKPVSATVFYDRLAWIANQPRPFWENDRYFGPDRRFREVTETGKPKRRSADQAENIEESIDGEQ